MHTLKVTVHKYLSQKLIKLLYMSSDVVRTEQSNWHNQIQNVNTASEITEQADFYNSSEEIWWRQVNPLQIYIM